MILSQDTNTAQRGHAWRCSLLISNQLMEVQFRPEQASSSATSSSQSSKQARHCWESSAEPRMKFCTYLHLPAGISAALLFPPLSFPMTKAPRRTRQAGPAHLCSQKYSRIQPQQLKKFLHTTALSSLVHSPHIDIPALFLHLLEQEAIQRLHLPTS